MSSLAVTEQSGQTSSLDDLARPVKDRLKQARDDRRGMEPIWHSNAAFASGKFWLEWSREQRQLVMPQDLQGKELYTADVITEYRETALGELGSDDDRPQLLLRRDDLPSEDFMDEINRGVSYGWDQEWDGDEALDEADRLCVDLGTSAIRVRFDPTVGAPAGEIPHHNGAPVYDAQQQRELLQYGPNSNVQMKPVKKGAIAWDPLSAFNILVPSGIPHERHFPWQGVIRPAPLDKVLEEYGNIAADLKPDGDIGSILGYDSNTGTSGMRYDYTGAGARPGMLRDHVWLFSYFEQPTRRWPQGFEMVLAGNKMKPLAFRDRLPVCRLDEDGQPVEWSSGISYFHWWRVTGRFWSRALIETMKDPQRGINKRRTQINEIIDRSMPFWFVQKDSNAINDMTGVPGAFVEIDKSEREPVASPGLAPGGWMQQDVEAMREDLEHATGIHGVRLGEGSPKAKTYGELALENENDQTKRQPILTGRQRSIARLVESSVYFMRTYWGDKKQLALAGDDDLADAASFNASQIPPFFIVHYAKGQAQPRGQAAKLKMIEDIAQYSINARTPLPVAWLKESLMAGEPLEIPEEQSDDQSDKAQLENHLMLEGHEVPVTYYDPPGVHIPIHRGAQIQAELSGDQQTWDRIEQHVQQHEAVAQQNAAAMPPPHVAGPPAPPAAPPTP